MLHEFVTSPVLAKKVGMVDPPERRQRSTGNRATVAAWWFAVEGTFSAASSLPSRPRHLCVYNVPQFRASRLPVPERP